MPPAKSPKGRAKGARAEPYPPSKPATNTEAVTIVIDDKENDSPNDSASPAPKPKSTRNKNDSKKDSSGEKASADLPDSYLDIFLEEK